jgi:integrase
MAAKRKRRRVPWNKGKIVGQKAPLKLREIWAVRVRLQLRSNLRDLALFNLAIDSKLRACDLLSLRVGDIAHKNRVKARAVVMQRKTRRSVQFEITEMSRDALQHGPARSGFFDLAAERQASVRVAQPRVVQHDIFNGKRRRHDQPDDTVIA